MNGTQCDPISRRDGFLVSVCLAESDDGSDRTTALDDLAARLAERFRYWEIVVVTAAGDTAIPNIRNLRIIRVTLQADHYRRREIAATEAIGDVVVLTAFHELAFVDPVAMAEAAWDGKTVIQARRRGRAGLLEPLLRVLGQSGGFRVSAATMQSLALPRRELGLVMGYPDRQLALRFLPRDAGIPVDYWSCAGPRRRQLSDLPRRVALVHSLLSHSAARVLSAVALLGALTALGSFSYLVYVLVVWIVRDRLAEGWLTLSLSIGASTLFLSTAIFGIAIGLRRVIDLLSAQDRDDVVGENSALDLFADLSRELNVTVEDDAASPVTDDGAR